MIQLKTIIVEFQLVMVMHTIIFVFEADLCDHEPTGGCYRILCDLQCQIERSKAELGSAAAGQTIGFFIALPTIII